MLIPDDEVFIDDTLPPLGAGEDARPTFTAGGAAEVGPAPAGAGTIPKQTLP